MAPLTTSSRKQSIITAGIFPAVIRELFPHAQITGSDQVLVCCPFHDDSTPSLSIKLSEGLYHCFSCNAAGNGFDLYMKVMGCDFQTALTAIESRAGIYSAESVQIAKQRPTESPSTEGAAGEHLHRPKVVATYYYHDAEGRRAYFKKRFEPGFNPGQKKSFCFYHKVDGKEIKGRGQDPLLYNMHLLSKNPAGEPVFVVEGERKADALTAWGLCATSFDSGGQSAKSKSGKSKTMWLEEWGRLFEGRIVYILPDNDTTGETYAVSVACKVLPFAESVKIVRLPGLPEKGDIVDFIKKYEEAA